MLENKYLVREWNKFRHGYLRDAAIVRYAPRAPCTTAAIFAMGKRIRLIDCLYNMRKLVFVWFVSANLQDFRAELLLIFLSYSVACAILDAKFILFDGYVEKADLNTIKVQK